VSYAAVLRILSGAMVQRNNAPENQKQYTNMLSDAQKKW